MNKKDLAKFKKALLQQKVTMTNKLNSRKLVSGEHEVGDEADTATQNSEREMQFELDQIGSIAIKEIDNALGKIENGTFGSCECCGEKISEARLNAIPWVRYCKECQEEAEKNSK